MPTDALSVTLAALADPTRRSLLAALAKRDLPVNALAAPHDMSLAAVSKHLKVLEAAGLISKGRDAQYRPCHLEPKPLQAVAEWLSEYERFWDRSLDALSSYLEELQRTPSPRRPRSRTR